MKKITINLLEDEEEKILRFMDYSNENPDSNYTKPWSETEVIGVALRYGLEHMLKPIEEEEKEPGNQRGKFRTALKYIVVGGTIYEN